MNLFKTCLLFALLTCSKALFAQDNPTMQPTTHNGQAVNVRPSAGQGYIAFNQGGTCILLYGVSATTSLNLKKCDPGDPNDKINTAIIVGPYNGTVYIWDNPDGQQDDDYMQITATNVPAGARITINTFNSGGAAPVVWYDNGAGGKVQSKTFYHNGLNGKVSRISRGIGQ